MLREKNALLKQSDKLTAECPFSKIKDMKRAGIAFIVVFVLGLSAYAILSSDDQVLRFPSGTVIVAEVANTPETREKGLMFRENLPKGGGLLFIFETEKPYQFWMKNCKFPIDIIWINTAKKVVHIAKDTPPCTGDPCPTYGPKNAAALYVLEVAAGFSEKEKIKLGTRIQF
ncbi:hypothetical protein MNBD_NITROSPIRAE01-516 [hydrothermal vent metagenome]|uniref:DUF192 domain-containing protein n=1 Tax=hydrothermal vent metagenome TaxID=652676 RepID=A0A3B1DCY0_9ZZZZ